MRLYVSQNQLKITANNPEQEEAEEILDVSYDGAEMEIGFNVSYVLDVLNALKREDAPAVDRLGLQRANRRRRQPGGGLRCHANAVVIDIGLSCLPFYDWAVLAILTYSVYAPVAVRCPLVNCLRR